MKKQERPTKHQISQNIRSLITIDLPNGEIKDIIETCDEFCTGAYDAGYNLGIIDGAIDYELKNPPINKEQSNYEYIVSYFSECKTLSDFQDRYKEAVNLYCNFI
jgi:hypothetical protein